MVILDQPLYFNNLNLKPMGNADLVKRWNSTFLAGDMPGYLAYLSEDFQFTGPVPEPIDREGYVGLMFTMLKACPDLNNNLEVMESSDNQVQGAVVMQGTHTADLDLSPMGMPVFPPTGKSFRLPKEPFTITILNGKITRFHAVVGEGGGLMGILGQLGLEVPH